MSYSCKILLDSISETGKRLTTFEVTFPRCVLAEAETHRVLRGWGGNIEEFIVRDLGINVDENLSRNSASSRAIPINKMLEMVRQNPFVPEKWGMPAKGMGAKEYYNAGTIEDMQLTREWNDLRHETIKFVERNMNIANKEDLNRALEPFMYHTAIITATEWDNFFKLRTNSAADWKIRKIADLMYAHYTGDFSDVKESYVKTPQQKLKVGEWHCPLVYVDDFKPIMLYLSKDKELDEPYAKDYDSFSRLEIESWHNRSAEAILDKYIEIKKKVSVARCARVSYLTHDGKRDIEKDLELFERLRTSGHWSPFEHVATPFYIDTKTSKLSSGYDERKLDMDKSEGWSRANTEDYAINLNSGNFIGWKQYRKEFADENCTNFRKDN